MKRFKLKIEDYGTVTLDKINDTNYDVFKSNGIQIGTICSLDYEDWDENDPIILSQIIEDFIDENDFYEDEDNDEDWDY